MQVATVDLITARYNIRQIRQNINTHLPLHLWVQGNRPLTTTSHRPRTSPDPTLDMIPLPIRPSLPVGALHHARSTLALILKNTLLHHPCAPTSSNYQLLSRIVLILRVIPQIYRMQQSSKLIDGHRRNKLRAKEPINTSTRSRVVMTMLTNSSNISNSGSGVQAPGLQITQTGQSGSSVQVNYGDKTGKAIQRLPMLVHNGTRGICIQQMLNGSSRLFSKLVLYIIL